MLELELKSVVDDLAVRCARVEAAGATLVFAGRLEDRRYDTPDRTLAARDEVLRVRSYRDGASGEVRAELDWKGPTRRDGGYKQREELGLHVGDAGTLVGMLERLGYVITVAIDREIRQYELHGATIRFESYPRLDVLVEVEGTPEAIERAIVATGLPRHGFTSERLSAFVRRFEERTGERAALSEPERTGPVRHDARDL